MGQYGTGTLTQQLWLARDASTGRLGLAFLKTEQFCTGINLETTVHLSFSTDQGATWSASERVSEAQYTRNDPVNGSAVCNTNSPRLAMAGGTVHLAWGASAGEQQPGGNNFWVGYYYASSTAAGVWTRRLLPHDGDDARKGNGVLSLALDTTGAPALAYVMRSVDNAVAYQNAFLYLRPGGTPVRMVDSGNVQNDNPQLSLAFDGVKPRVAGLLTRSAAEPRATWMFRSDDGAVFSEARVPDDARDQGGDYMDLSWKGGKGVLAYRYGTSSMHGQCGGPKLSRSTDAVTWTTCGADEQSHQFLGNFVSAELAATGKLVAAFHAPVDEATPARWQRGIVVWREP